jgi:transcriptional regulator with XRE-family HTH domain
VEFHEKLQELRKRKGLTQEELAEALYVSRTAISKWESGRGYPGIESLKHISTYFGVSIDDLLSGEQLLSLAERENKGNLQRICDFLSGAVDLLALLLIVLPLYPKTVDEYVYAVNLMTYGDVTGKTLVAYWGLFATMAVLGILRIAAGKWCADKYSRVLSDLSMTIGVAAVIYLALCREPYAATLAFLMIVIKGSLMLRSCGIMNPSKQ